MTDDTRPPPPTDAFRETELGRVALWLDVADLRWLAVNCSCTDSAPDATRERCDRIRFRANAALHKAGHKTLDANDIEA